MALIARLALKNLQKRVLVSSPSEALVRSFSAIDVSNQGSEGNKENPKLVPESSRGKKKWLWRNNGGEFHLGNSLIQAGENINRVLKSLNLSRRWWVLGGRVKKEQEECYKLRLEMAGIGKEDVKVSVEGRILSIRGEHREEEGEESGDWTAESYGYYDTVAEEIKAELKDGVLKIVIPRSEKRSKDVKEMSVS